MPTCPCGASFAAVTNKKWCRQACPARLKRRYESSHRWYLRNKAKPYDPNGVCPCGADFIRRYGGQEQRYCSSTCRAKFQSRHWSARRLERRHLINRASRLKRHGLKFDNYLALYEAQGAVCAICGGTDPGATHGRKRRYFSIDHCHLTGTVRGLLCNPCNLGLGAFRDQPDRLRAAAAYLDRHAGTSTRA